MPAAPGIEWPAPRVWTTVPSGIWIFEAVRLRKRATPFASFSGTAILPVDAISKLPVVSRVVLRAGMLPVMNTSFNAGSAVTEMVNSWVFDSGESAIVA